MRIKLLLSLAALAPMAMMAETLSPEAALQRALSNSQLQKITSSASAPRLLYTELETKTNTPAAYVYSRGEEGFMILSADDIALPVLGYSDESKFDTNDIPENMKAWLAFYADEIAWARENGVPTYSPEKSTRADRAPIAPLVSTRWNQTSPYNNMCPKDGNKLSVTGCVATAMAQIMNYHQYPVGPGTGKASVTVSGTTYTMDFSQTTFDWNNMLDTYTSAATEAQKDAVALLMKACGFSVKMTYRSSASGAVQALVSSALANNFGYDKGVRNAKRDCYLINDWNDLIYDQLTKKQPVQYGGQSSGGGHSFVCDGYSSDNYFHINWGWGGMSDGYFLLSVLDPDNQGTGGSSNGSGFDADQDIVYDIRKPAGTTSIVPGMYAQSFSIASKTAGFNSQLSASITGLGNLSAVSNLDAMLGIAFINKSTGARIIFTGTTTISGLSPGSYYPSAISIVVSTRSKSDIPPGEYDVVPVFSQGVGSAATYTWYQIPVYVGTPTYTATVTSSNITFNTLEPSIKTTDIVPETLYIGSPSKVTVTIENTGSATYASTIICRLRKGSTTTLAYNGPKMSIEVPANSTATFDYYITVPSNVAAGTYNIVFLNDKNTIITSKAKTGVQVEKAPELKLSFGALKVVGDANAVDPNNVHFAMDLTCTSFTYSGTFPIYFFPPTGGTSLDMLSSNKVNISAGETQTVNFQGSVSLDYNTKYMCCVNYNDSWVTNQCTFTTMADASGIEDVAADSEVVSVTYYTLQGVKVQNPSAGTYIKVTAYAGGRVASEKVYVK